MRTRINSLARTVGPRLILLGGALVLVFLVIGNVRSVIPWWSTVEPSCEEPEPDASATPGWPHRRGPHYDAVSDETDLADSWPPKGPPALWTREIGRGYSGLIAVGDRVFTQAQSLTGQSVVCLDADTGKQVWGHRYGWPYEPGGMYPGPRATPTWHEGRVFFAGPRGLVGCLRASDGGPVWRLNVNEEFAGRGTDFGYACSPLVEDGKVILPVGGLGASVVALDARDGSTVWASGDEPASYCSAIPISFRGRRYVVGFLQNALSIFDLKTGELVAEEKYSSGYDEHAAAPLYEEPLLMVARPFQGGAECYRLEADAPEAGNVRSPKLALRSVWYSRKMSNDTASGVLLKGHVYGFDLRDVQAKAHRPSRGKFKCLQFATGEVRWETDQVGHATVIAADGKLILFNDRGEVLLARASPKRYEELARTELFSGEICWTAPSLHRGRLYLRSPSKAACLYLGEPERLSPQQRQAARPASEIPQPSRLDWAWLAGGERPYVFDPPDAAELGLWYAFSLIGVLGVAAVVAALVRRLTRVRWPTAAGRYSRAVFWSAALVLGVVGTPVYSLLCQRPIFTWPTCLFVVHQVALNVIVRAGRHARSRESHGGALMATLLFLGVCLAYFLVCRRLSRAVEWAFLLGFLPSWPIAVPAAYRLQHEGPLWRDLLWAVLSFSAFFWAVGAFFLWKAATL